MTLDEMVRICATDCEIDEILDTEAPYTADALKYFNRFKNAINYCKNKITREKYEPVTIEIVQIDDNKMFALSDLAKNFNNIKKITNIQDDKPCYWEQVSTNQIMCETSEKEVRVKYSYIPADLVNYDDVLDFPISKVDPHILCFYASYKFLIEESETDSSNKADYLLTLFNDGFENIQNDLGEPKKVIESWW